MAFAINKIVSSVSTGVTAFTCAGFLVHAMLTDNGGHSESQQQWQEAAKHKVGLMDEIDARIAANRNQKNLLLDRMMVGSIATKPVTVDEIKQGEAKPEAGKKVGVLDLIRQNSDVAPPVSSGTNRVSVTIKEGDTLYSIARKHGLNVDQLAALNGLSEPYVIKIGQPLFVAR